MARISITQILKEVMQLRSRVDAINAKLDKANGKNAVMVYDRKEKH